MLEPTKKSVRVFSQSTKNQPLTAAERQKLLRMQRAQARQTAKQAARRTAEERAIAAAKAAKVAEFWAKHDEISRQPWVDTEVKDAQKSELFQQYEPHLPASKTKLPRMSAGSVMKDAPRGCGLLITGGFGAKQIAEIVDAGRRDHHGVEPWHGEGRSRRVKAQGTDASQYEQGGSFVRTEKGIRHVVDKAQKFEVNLGEASESYFLTEKQIELEKLIKSSEGEIALLQQAEDARLNQEFLLRIEAGPIQRDTAQVTENKEASAICTNNAGIEADNPPNGTIH